MRVYWKEKVNVKNSIGIIRMLKNLVDAEIMMGILNNKGYKLIGDFEEADVIIVNTCGFIESAKQESIDTIINFSELKKLAI